MRSVNEIKKGMQSKNQDEWATFDEIDSIMDKVEQYEKALKDIVEIPVTWSSSYENLFRQTQVIAKKNIRRLITHNPMKLRGERT